ncbi:MAG: glycine--tRNA ligase subunit beta [Brevinematales bacterium]|nr:glycine--tRNA ligase subunit beta [Brevinematales bacterium]
MGKTLLIELGVEEIPHGILSQTIEEFKNKSKENLDNYGFEYSDLKIMATPRRLTLLINNLSEKTKSKVIEKKGPSLKAAFDENGNPTKALSGFLSSNKAELKDIIKDNGYIYIKTTEGGISIDKILTEFVEKTIFSIDFPKTMKWGSGDTSFVRPIRWISSIYGNKLLPIKIKDIPNVDYTYGHRILSSSKVEIKNSEDYQELLKKTYVIVDHEERKSLILKGVKEKADSLNATPVLDDKLLDYLVNLTEFPVVAIGEFEKEFLELPKEVLTSEMIEHQKYIPLLGKDDKLLNKFLIVLNTFETPEIVKGNERVIRARFSDGKFFFDEDRKINLIDYLPRLKDVLFIKGLGSMYEKVERIKFLTSKIIEKFNWQKEKEEALRVATLSKCDLVTNMVYEFPELQGIIGYYYALHSGESEKVAVSIMEHYKPKFSGDKLPTHKAGLATSLADRFDNLFALYAIGNYVTGSKDPYALRRQTLGIIRILIENQLHLNIEEFLLEVFDTYKNYLKTTKEEFVEKVLDFITIRTKTVLKEYGFEVDEIEAGLVGGVTDIYDAFMRIKAINKLRKTEGFINLATTFKRIKNIIKNQKISPLNEKFFVEEAEKKLFEFYKSQEKALIENLNKKNYEEFALTLSGFRNIVDEFFDKVLVMDKNEDIKNNRIALLSTIDSLFSKLIDFEKIVIE